MKPTEHKMVPNEMGGKRLMMNEDSVQSFLDATRVGRSVIDEVALLCKELSQLETNDCNARITIADDEDADDILA